MADGAYRQSEDAIAWSYLPESGGPDFSVSLKARKISGREGFIIPVGLADGRRVQWNLGGWGNRLHAVQVADAVVGEQTPGVVETGRWYDIRIDVRDRTVRGFVDGALVQERTLPRVDRILAVGGRDDRTGDIVLKVVNSAPETQSMTLRLDGVAPAGRQATATTLTGDPLAENTFDEPTKIVPRSVPLKLGASAFTYAFPAHSLTVIRVPAR